MIREKNIFAIPDNKTLIKTIRLINDKNSLIKNRNRLMAELAYGSGVRRCELVRMNVEDVDLEEGTVYVNGKGRKIRKVPITYLAIKAAQNYLIIRGYNRGPLFITRTGKRLKPVSVGWIFKNRIGIRTHLMRHACAVHMLKNGCDIRYIQELLGHSSLSTTQVYTKVSCNDLGKVVNSKHPRANIYTT